jgi:hypothetical protein
MEHSKNSTYSTVCKFCPFTKTDYVGFFNQIVLWRASFTTYLAV